MFFILLITQKINLKNFSKSLVTFNRSFTNGHWLRYYLVKKKDKQLEITESLRKMYKWGLKKETNIAVHFYFFHRNLKEIK